MVALRRRASADQLRYRSPGPAGRDEAANTCSVAGGNTTVTYLTGTPQSLGPVQYMSDSVLTHSLSLGRDEGVARAIHSFMHAQRSPPLDWTGNERSNLCEDPPSLPDQAKRLQSQYTGTLLLDLSLGKFLGKKKFGAQSPATASGGTGRPPGVRLGLH